MDTAELHLHLENGLGFCDTIDIQFGLARAGLVYIPFFHYFFLYFLFPAALLCGAVSYLIYFSWSRGNFLVRIKSSSIYSPQLTNNPRPKRNNTQTTKVELSSQKPATLTFNTIVGITIACAQRRSHRHSDCENHNHPPSASNSLISPVLRLIHVLDRPRRLPSAPRQTTGTWSPSRMFGRTQLSFAEDKWPAHHPPCSAHPPPRRRRNPSPRSSL